MCLGFDMMFCAVPGSRAFKNMIYTVLLVWVLVKDGSLHPFTCAHSHALKIQTAKTLSSRFFYSTIAELKFTVVSLPLILRCIVPMHAEILMSNLKVLFWYQTLVFINWLVLLNWKLWRFSLFELWHRFSIYKGLCSCHHLLCLLVDAQSFNYIYFVKFWWQPLLYRLVFV